MKTITVKAMFLEESLGLSPSQKDIYAQFIASNAPDAKTREEEIAERGEDAVTEDKRTVFTKDSDGCPMFYDYQIKGFFKDSCGALQRMKGESIAKQSNSPKMRSYKKIIDGTIFVYPRHIRIDTHGEEMGICERPLRASTPQGERIALASSETVPVGSEITFQVMCPDAYEDVVREWLDYGAFRGISQWRNSGKGRFTYEILRVDSDHIKIDLVDGRIDAKERSINKQTETVKSDDAKVEKKEAKPTKKEKKAPSLEDMGLKSRSFNALKKGNLTTIEDVLKFDEKYHLSSLTGLGKSSFNDVAEAFSKFGYTVS